MIEATGLVKYFGSHQALKDISFKVESSSVVGFLGANGAGKTTTMDILCGCVGADAGTVEICGIDLLEQPEKAKSCIGYLPDEPPLYLDMRVKEYVEHAGRLRGIHGKRLSRRVEEVLYTLDLADVASRLIGNLSKGYKQRVGLAQAIVHEPEVLVLDEPTEGLDPSQIIHIRELIQNLGKNHTILLSSHILSEVENVCDQIVIIHEGRIVKQGTYQELTGEKDGITYLIRLSQNENKFSETIKRVEGVTRWVPDQTNQNHFLVTFDHEQHSLDPLLRQLLPEDFGIQEISLVPRKLEEVFLQLTH